MTREDAIKRLEWLRMVGNHVDSVTLGKEDMPCFDMAIAALREQEERSINEPLTPDELRKMGGKPYFHVSLQTGQKHWAILDPFYARKIEYYHYGEYWLAYRYEWNTAEQKTPCAACGYGGKHLDAPPCTTCPAHPKLESNLKVVESTERSEAVTKCNDLYDEDGGEVFNRTESDAVKVVDSDRFKTNADHIRSMTDEELAMFLESFGSCNHCPQYGEASFVDSGIPTCDGDCEQHISDWLKQPYKENT